MIETLGPEQRMLLSEALGRLSVADFASAYQGWDLPWAGFINELDLILVIRQLLNISEDQLSDDQAFSIWLSLRDDYGQIPVEDFLALGH